jgi:hypothetical protein
MTFEPSTSAAQPAGYCAQCGGQLYVNLVHHCSTAVAPKRLPRDVQPERAGLPPIPEHPYCYHRRRHSTTHISGTQTWTKVKCMDCGAEVSAVYGAPIPDMPPMPIPVSS